MQGHSVLGFVDMVDAETEYHYDENGNMDVDDNKGFVFAYNYLNLPEEVVGGTDTVRYIYDATGIKMSKELVQGGAISYTNYVGNFVYKDGDLDYIVTDEGRITQPTAGTFQYEYFLKDHLGNTRTVFADGNGDGILADNEVLQENHYYPFGMSIGDLVVDRGADNKLKYNGKELQDETLNGVKVNLMDYGARYYMPDVPVFTTCDPLTEKYTGISPYAYALNNPISFTDPDGQEPDDPQKNNIMLLINPTSDQWEAAINAAMQGNDNWNIISSENINEGAEAISDFLGEGGQADNIVIRSHGAEPKTNENEIIFPDIRNTYKNKDLPFIIKIMASTKTTYRFRKKL